MNTTSLVFLFAVSLLAFSSGLPITEDLESEHIKHVKDIAVLKSLPVDTLDVLVKDVEFNPESALSAGKYLFKFWS